MSADNQQPFLIHSESTSETTAESHHTRSAALTCWLAVKSDLEKQLPRNEWNLWVRPALLLKVMSGGVLLIALPPNRQIIDAAKARTYALKDLVQSRGYSGVVFTRYPALEERERARQEYPDFYAQMFGNPGKEAGPPTACTKPELT